MTLHVSHCRISLVAVLLLISVGASCGSDSATESSTAVTTAVTTAATATSVGTSASDTAAPSDGGSDTTADRAAIVDFVQFQAATAGVALDDSCVVDLVAQLSDADAKTLAAGARAGDEQTPPLSAEGEALGQQLIGCASAIDTTTTTTTG